MWNEYSLDRYVKDRHAAFHREAAQERLAHELGASRRGSDVGVRLLALWRIAAAAPRHADRTLRRVVGVIRRRQIGRASVDAV